MATGVKVSPARLDGLGHHRRRRRLDHRRQPPDARHPPQSRPQDHPVQQPDLRPDQGPVFAHSPLGKKHQEHADGVDRQSASPAVDGHRLPKRRSSPASIDVDIKHLAKMLRSGPPSTRAPSFVEVYQNCNVFNDGAFEYATDKRNQGRTTLYLEHGKPLIFGKNRDKGIRLHGMDPEVVEAGQRHHRGRPAVPRREGGRTEPGLSAQPHASSRFPRADRRLPLRRRGRPTRRC